MRHFDIDFLFFFFHFFHLIFFRNSFSNSFIVRSRSSYLFSQWKCTSGLVLLCFLKLALPFDHGFRFTKHDFHVWLLTYFTHCFNWMDLAVLGRGFLFTCGILTLIFCVFFSIFSSDFFRISFSNSFIVRSRSSYLFSQWKCTSGLVLLCFFFNSLYLLITVFVLQNTIFMFDFWLTSLTVSTEWILNSFTHSFTQCGEYCQSQKIKIKRRDKPIKQGH